MSVVVLAPLLLFLPQRPRKGLVELRSRRGVHDCSGFVSGAGACFSLWPRCFSWPSVWPPRCRPEPSVGLQLGASTQALPAPLNGGCWRPLPPRRESWSGSWSKFSVHTRNFICPFSSLDCLNVFNLLNKRLEPHILILVLPLGMGYMQPNSHHLQTYLKAKQSYYI